MLNRKNIKSDLLQVIKKGYEVALDSCFEEKSFYLQGFIDAINYIEHGIISKSEIDKIIEQYEQKQ